MKVLVINGSPRANQCTATALEEVMKTLQAEGVEPGRDVMLSVASRDGSSGMYVIGGGHASAEVIR